ncbi:hypothetical protein LOK49_LG02G03325 [Camellia lanceoleosa]|uniref:Uncharacterized protein n=1 Tax=Camellia lanceoleosa TaxID=1840588 RepID=A0ACC0IWI2_9ERIC|nr:hypothetical protein LOK49_LG02G03325 [Camellia lanceoleosa]
MKHYLAIFALSSTLKLGLSFSLRDFFFFFFFFPREISFLLFLFSFNLCSGLQIFTFRFVDYAD